MNKKVCELCEKEVPSVSAHHLVPKQCGGKNAPVVLLCTNCHNQIHAIYTNRELSYKYNTIDKLKAHERIQPYLRFIKTIPDNIDIPVKRSRYVRKRGRY